MEKLVIFMLNIVHQLSTFMVVNIMSICVTLVVGMGLNVVAEVFILLVIIIVVITAIVRSTFVDVSMLSFFVMVRVMSLLMVLCITVEILSLSTVLAYLEIRGTVVNNVKGRLVMNRSCNLIVMLIAKIHLLIMVGSDLSIGIVMFGWGLFCIVLTVIMGLHRLFVVAVFTTVHVMIVLLIVMIIEMGHLEGFVKRSDIDLFGIVISVLVVIAFSLVVMAISFVMCRHAFMIELKELLVRG